jgi:hypothetical protein
LVIHYLLQSHFQLVILNVGMTASKQLTDLLNKRQGCLATSTYHPVLVASNTRNQVTSAAARLTLAAGARLTRLALDAALNSELEALGLLEIFSELMGSKEKAKDQGDVFEPTAGGTGEGDLRARDLYRGEVQGDNEIQWETIHSDAKGSGQS